MDVTVGNKKLNVLNIQINYRDIESRYDHDTLEITHAHLMLMNIASKGQLAEQLGKIMETCNKEV